MEFQLTIGIFANPETGNYIPVFCLDKYCFTARVYITYIHSFV